MQICFSFIRMPGLETSPLQQCQWAPAWHPLSPGALVFRSPELYKLGGAGITVVMNVTVWLRFCACCIICFANLSWADWISLSFFFNLSRFWNWENKIFHSWEKRIKLGNEPRWRPQTVYFLHWNNVSAFCALACFRDLLCKLHVMLWQQKEQELGVSHLGRALTRRMGLKKALLSINNNVIYEAPTMC